MEESEDGVANTERFMKMTVFKDDGSPATFADKIRFIHHIKNCENKEQEQMVSVPFITVFDSNAESSVETPEPLLHGKSNNILYSMDPEYRGPGFINGRFSGLHFDFQVDQWKNKPNDLVSKIEIGKEDAIKNFRRDVKRFSKEITQRLFKVYKWEIPVSVAYVVATVFTCQFMQLETIYQQHKKIIFPKSNAPVDFVVS